MIYYYRYIPTAPTTFKTEVVQEGDKLRDGQICIEDNHAS